MAAPLGAVVSAITGAVDRRPRAVAGGLLGVAVAADIWRSPTVPAQTTISLASRGAVALGEWLREKPIPGLRVWLVSAGAEETLQEGVRGFMQRHRGELDPDSTWMLVPDTVGSGQLIMPEGEGPFRIHYYTDPSFRDLVERCAHEEGIMLERGFGTLLDRRRDP